MNALVIVLFLGVIVFFQEFSGSTGTRDMEHLNEAEKSNRLDLTNPGKLFSCHYTDDGVPYRNLARDTSVDRTSASDSDVLDPAKEGLKELSESQEALSEPIDADEVSETVDLEE